MKVYLKKKMIMGAFIAMLSVFVLVLCCCENHKNHIYQNGICIDCGKSDPNYVAPCNHKYTNGICEVCGESDPNYVAPCNHNYNNGVCTVCGESDPDYIPPCAHTFVEGVCSKCGVACAHEYVEGICSVCDSWDPDYIPADNGRSMYDDIVSKFKYLVLYKYMNEELPPRGGTEPFYIDPLYEVCADYDPSMNMGYAYKDVDGDGYVELVLTENGCRMYAMFTIVDRAPALVATFQKGMGYLGNNGMVFYNTKSFDSTGGQIALGNHMMRLENGELVGTTYGWEDADGNFNTDDDEQYYCIAEDGVKQELTYDEYKVYRNMYEYYWSYPTRLTKLNNLRPYPAIIEDYITDHTADFSSYDAIIKTFSLMHSEVGGSKFVRSKWASGAYDMGMHFTSDEDFVIYNRIIAACVLVQKNEKAVFGYAKSDLNGDGTDELIILERNFHVIAIFTEIDGDIVLLDSYNDLRTAFIDAEGLIHVRQQIIPGSSSDFEYFVYEVGEGTLNSIVSIGTKTNSDASQEYEIIDGSRVDIEKTEWDTLYASYLTDIGSDTFDSYTKNKSGLTFVNLPEN